MAIEVRQLVIKSTVVKEGADTRKHSVPSELDLREVKAEILSECKQAIADALRESRER